MTHEDRLARALEAWVERRDRGDPIDPKTFLREWPDLAEDLRPRIVALEALGALERAVGPSDLPAAVPETIGEYRIVREIGRGGMGVVYEAEQTSLRRRVALKVLAPSILSTSSAVRRFQREAQTAGRLHHTNLVPVYAMGRHAGYWYFAMELVEGKPLHRMLAGRRPRRADASPRDREDDADGAEAPELSTASGERRAYARVAEAFAGVAEALHLAHEEGICHRDVKPSNLILAADGTLKIVDFGLARETDAEGPSVTLTGDLVGTPAYMSPEQAMARRVPVDFRTDVYSLGATLYEVLTSRPPFAGETLQDLCAQILTRDPVRPRALDGRIPRDLETVVLKAMEKDPARRYASAAAFARDLRAFAAGGAIEARHVGWAGLAWRRARRHPGRAATVAVVVALAAAAALLAAKAEREEARWRAGEYRRLVAEADDAASSVPRESHDSMFQSLPSAQEARDLYTRAIEVDAEPPDAWIGRALVPGEPLASHLADVEAARERGLPPRTVHLARAHLLSAAGREAEAVEESRIAEAHPVGSALEALVEARVRVWRWDLAKARAALDRGVGDSAPGSAVRRLALRVRGELSMDSGTDEAALRDLSAVAALGDRSLSVAVRLASLWRRLGRTEAAEREYRRVVEDVRRGGKLGPWLLLSRACRMCKETAWCLEASEEALRAFPEDPLVARERAAALGVAKDWDGAVALARKVVSERDDGHASQALLGHLLVEARRFAEALPPLRRAAGLDPRCASCASDLATALLETGEPAAALERVEEACRLAPRSVDYVVAKGNVLRRLRRPREALAVFESLLPEGDGRADLHGSRGVLLMELGEDEKARAALERAVSLDPRYVEAHQMLGECLERLGLPDEALGSFERALAVAPDSVPALVSRAFHLGLRKGQVEDALRLLDRALSLDDRYVPAHAARARVRAAKGDLEGAETDFGRALELDPGRADGWFHRGTFHLNRTHRWADALSDFDRAIALDERTVDSREHRAQALRALGRTLEALEELARAEERGSTDTTHHATVAATLRQLGRYEEAERRLDAALAREPHAVGHRERGLLLRTVRRHEESIAAWDRVGEEDGLYPVARYLRAEALRDMDRLEEALEGFSAIANRWHWEDAAVDRLHVLVLLGRLTSAPDPLLEAAKGSDDPDLLKPVWECLRLLGAEGPALVAARKLHAGDPRAHAPRLVASLRAAGEGEEAVRVAREGLLATPLPDERLAFAYLAAAAGEREKARALLAAWGFPWQVEDLLEAARVRAVLGDRDEAAALLARAREKGLARKAFDPDLAGIR